MDEFDPISEWFSGSFRIQAQPKSGAHRDHIRSRCGFRPAKRGGFSPKGGVSKIVRENAISVLKKSPEVMVKITKSDYGLKTMKRHLDYISRNGKLELTTESGDSIMGRSAVYDLKEQFKYAGIPLEGNKREFIRCIFSMPAGTPPEELQEAVQNFCKDEFSNRRYVIVLHNDTDHVHCHVLIGTRDIDREDEKRLNPNRNDLFRWRQGFAENLRELGIEAAASQRKHRFQYQRSERSEIRHIREENPKSTRFNAKRQQAIFDKRLKRAIEKPEKAFVGPYRPSRTPRIHEQMRAEIKQALRTGVRPKNPAHKAMERNRKNTINKWEKVRSNLQSSHGAGNKEISTLIDSILEQGKSEPRTKSQEIFDLATSSLKQKQRGKTIEKSINELGL